MKQLKDIIKDKSYLEFLKKEENAIIPIEL